MHKNWHKSLICPEYAILSLVHCSVHETCAERFFLRYSVAFCSPIYPWQKEHQKQAKYDIFSLLSGPVCRTRKRKLVMCVSKLYPKLRIMHKKLSFHDTTLQLVQNVHQFESSAIGRIMLHCSALWLVCRTRPTKIRISVRQLYRKLRNVQEKGPFLDNSANFPEYAPFCFMRHVMLHSSSWCPYSTKAKNMVKSTASLYTKDLEQTWAAPRSNCWQGHALFTDNEISITNVVNVHSSASNPEMLPLVYGMQHSSSVWIHIRKAKHTRKSMLLCYLKLCVRCTWNQEGMLSDRNVW